MTRFETILVPVDFSDHSKEALDTAIQIAHLFGSTIHLLHCYHIQTAGISPYGIVLPSGYYADIRDAAEKRLNDWHEMVSNDGIQSESLLSSNSPSLAINLAAEEIEADLIVMRTRGLSTLKHAVLGSVAETPAGTPSVPYRPPLTMMAAKSSILPPSKSGHARTSGEPRAVQSGGRCWLGRFGFFVPGRSVRSCRAATRHTRRVTATSSSGAGTAR